MESVFVVGHLGNMGSRYRAVLNHLNIAHSGVDVGDAVRIDYVSRFDGIIIATPTEHHLYDIERYLGYQKPILVEKPIVRSYAELEDFFNRLGQKNRSLITMINQYVYLDSYSTGPGETEYNYFKHGGDGIWWDCINVVGLSEKRPTLKQSSPVWTCKLNGQQIPIKEMDYAYIDMIKDWTSNPKSNWEYALEAHRKVEAWQKF